MLTSAADRPWNCHHSPFRVSLSITSLAARPPPCAARAQHRIRAHQTLDAPVSTQPAAIMEVRGGLAPATGRVRLTLPENATSCSCASSTCAIASDSRRIAHGTWNETAVRMVPSGERGWTKRAESTHVYPLRAVVTVTLAANMRGGLWTQIVYEG